jgi:soluble lytic murein transglycosylase-like protein
MTFSRGFNGLSQILGRIKEVDRRIDTITGQKTVLEEAQTENVSGKVSESQFGSFANVLSGMRQNLPPRANRWVVEDAVQKASEATGVDIDLLKAVMQQESGGNSSAVSSAGAKGLMQMIDSTAASMGVTDPFDPHQSAMGGAKYLKQQLDRFGGNIALALAAYNAGPQAVTKYAGIPPYAETQNYVRSIASIYDGFKRKKNGVS